MRKLLISASIIAMGLAPAYAPAEDLVGAFYLALKNDPAFKQAAADKMSVSQNLNIAKSTFRPSVNLNASRTLFNRVINKVAPNRFEATNNLQNYSAVASQRLFDWSSLMQVKLSQAEKKRANALYAAALQDLMLRVSRAYFLVLEAQDTLRFTISEKNANERQLAQALERYKVGLDAVTAVDEARAEYDATVALEITARNDVDNAKEVLREITGVYLDYLVPVRENLPLRKPDPENVDYWVKLGLEHNYTLQASRYRAETAKRNIGVNIGGNLPVLDMTANFSDNRGNNFGTGALDQETRNLGFQLSFPVLQGGAVVARTRQAQYDYESALAELDGTIKSVISNGHQLYNSVISGISAVKADRQAVKSRISSLNSTEAAYKVGTRTIVDVLDQQRDLFDTQRQLASDQYRYLNDFLSLKNNGGTLNIADIEEINSWLQNSHAKSTLSQFHERPHPDIIKPFPSTTNPYQVPKDNRLRHIYATKEIRGEGAKNYNMLPILPRDRCCPDLTAVLLLQDMPFAGSNPKLVMLTPPPAMPSALKTSRASRLLASLKQLHRPSAKRRSPANSQQQVATKARANQHKKTATAVPPSSIKQKQVAHPKAHKQSRLFARIKHLFKRKHAAKKAEPTTLTKHENKTIAKPQQQKLATPAKTSKQVLVQTGAFTSQKSAEKQSAIMHKFSHQPTHVAIKNSKSKPLYLVQIGPLTDSDSAQKIQAKLKREKHISALILVR